MSSTIVPHWVQKRVIDRQAARILQQSNPVTRWRQAYLTPNEEEFIRVTKRDRYLLRAAQQLPKP